METIYTLLLGTVDEDGAHITDSWSTDSEMGARAGFGALVREVERDRGRAVADPRHVPSLCERGRGACCELLEVRGAESQSVFCEGAQRLTVLDRRQWDPLG